MLRTTASRRSAGTALAVAAAAGIGFGAYNLGSASDAAARQGSPVALEATATPPPAEAKDAPTTTPPAAPTTTSPLTLEQAKAVAARVAPGRVIEWDEDDEPTGLRYDVTLLHSDGSTTDVEVDTVTGRVTSIDHDDDRD
jgi:uncharacterized membrane protein YkoI